MSHLTAEAVVVGAGACGGWTALRLQERGWNTLLIDSWGAGHLRAGSGGETRILRFGYADRDLYSQWAWEALSEWKRRQEDWQAALFEPCGILWIGTDQTPQLIETRRVFERLGLPLENLEEDEIARRLPGFHVRPGERALAETSAGILRARLACRLVLKAFQEAGGHFEAAQVLPPQSGTDQLGTIKLSDGRSVSAQVFVWCCGAWIGRLLPSLNGLIRPTRQEVVFFGLPAGGSATLATIPAWYDYNEGDFYGLPCIDQRGLKIACDRLGPPIDPDRDERLVGAEGLEAARSYLRRRLPDQAHAPVMETRVCQYAATPDRHLILDRHPAWKDSWIAGGGSGHGFKLGPVIGRRMVEMIEDSTSPPAEVRLDRFE